MDINLKNTFKKLYSFIPFKKQLFIILKKIWVPPFYQHLHFKGVIQVPVTNTESFKIKHYGFVVENEIFWKGLKGEWEKESVSLWIELCRMSNSILDVGANTGVYSLIAKAVNPNAKIYAFEPVHRVYEKLLENNRINGYDIVCEEYAASNYTGEATIYDTDTEHTYSVTVNVDRPTSELQTAPTKIKTITLDEYIQLNSISTIDLIKLDVETHEPEVLEGFKTYLNQFQPTILIEILNNEIGVRIENIVKPLGYLFFSVDEKNGIKKSDNIKQIDYNYLLCSAAIAKQLNLINTN